MLAVLFYKRYIFYGSITGTPPPYARLLHYQPNSTGHTPLSSGNYNSPDEDVHIRLEDTFPKMPQRTPSTRKSLHGQYKEEVVLNSSLGGSTTRSVYTPYQRGKFDVRTYIWLLSLVDQNIIASLCTYFCKNIIGCTFVTHAVSLCR